MSLRVMLSGCSQMPIQTVWREAQGPIHPSHDTGVMSQRQLGLPAVVVCVCVCVIRADRQLTSGRSYTAPTEATFNTSSLLYIYGNAIGCMCYIIIHQDRYWQEHRGNIYPLKYTRPVSWKKIILTVSIKMTWRYSTSSVSKNFFLN